MCMCGKPTLNGEPGYSWDGKRSGTRPIDPPDLREGDELLYDEPGRCGGLDSHSHHFRIVNRRGSYALLVRHGGGDERVDLGVAMRSRPGDEMALAALAACDSNARYWLLHTIFNVHRAAQSQARNMANEEWRQAAADKRIKTRKVRAGVKVWVEPREMVAVCGGFSGTSLSGT